MMTVLEALAALAAAEQAVLTTLDTAFPVGSTLTLEIGTPATPHQLRGQVVGAVTLVALPQQLALAVQLGAHGPAQLTPLAVVMDSAEARS